MHLMLHLPPRGDNSKKALILNLLLTFEYPPEKGLFILGLAKRSNMLI
ncbi:Uncharacterised protein [Klebsiella pneumoniae]|nr:Uncharacterised protein [Klebsiella pneumoniae]